MAEFGFAVGYHKIQGQGKDNQRKGDNEKGMSCYGTCRFDCRLQKQQGLNHFQYQVR